MGGVQPSIGCYPFSENFVFTGNEDVPSPVVFTKLVWSCNWGGNVLVAACATGASSVTRNRLKPNVVVLDKCISRPSLFTFICKLRFHWQRGRSQPGSFLKTSFSLATRTFPARFLSENFVFTGNGGVNLPSGERSERKLLLPYWVTLIVCL